MREIEAELRAIAERCRPQLELIERDPGLGQEAARIYLSYCWLLAKGRIVGTPRARGNLRRISRFVSEESALLERILKDGAP